MKLSSPIHVLKSNARKLRHQQNIKLNEAQDQIAQQEGFQSWSHLMSQRDELIPSKFNEVLDFLNPGDLVLVGARPQMGKTLFTSSLLNQASAQQATYLYSLAESPTSLAPYLNDKVKLDCSDNIQAESIIHSLEGNIEPGTVVALDYLQLIGENRAQPALQDQVAALGKFAERNGAIIVIISQLDRKVESREDKQPTIADVRLPNPLDLGLFNKVFLLHREFDSSIVEVTLAGRAPHRFTAEVRQRALA